MEKANLLDPPGMGALPNQLLATTLFPNPQTVQTGHEFFGSHNMTVLCCKVWDWLVL